MATDTANDWFKDASTPITDIAHMLMDLDDKGLIPDEMRGAIHKHAENETSTIPLSIGALASAMASAFSGGSGLCSGDAANAAWGIAALSEKMHAMNELGFWFGPENTMRKVLVTA